MKPLPEIKPCPDPKCKREQGVMVQDCGTFLAIWGACRCGMAGPKRKTLRGAINAWNKMVETER